MFKNKINLQKYSEYKDNSEETNPIIDNILVSHNKYSTLYEKDFAEIKFNSITSLKSRSINNTKFLTNHEI